MRVLANVHLQSGNGILIPASQPQKDLADCERHVLSLRTRIRNLIILRKM